MAAALQVAQFFRQAGVVDRIVCADCDGRNVRAATVTTEFVYLRCGDCGEVWSIRDRRQTPRPADRRKF